MNLWERAKERRWELAAVVTITAVVVGIPWLSNGGLSWRGASHGGAATPTTTTLPAGLPGSGPGPAGDPAPAPPAGAGSFGDDDFLALLASVSAPAAAPPTSVAAPASPATTAPNPATNTSLVPGPSPTLPTTTAPRVSNAAPRAPTNLALDFGGTTLSVHWDSVLHKVDGFPFDGSYQVSLRTAAATQNYETTETSFGYTVDQNRLDFGAPQGELVVSVRAVDTAGTAGAPVSGIAVHDPPDTPPLPPVLVAGAGFITVTGQVPVAVTDLAGFDIYEYQPGSPDPYVLVGSTAGTGAFVHDALAPGSTHIYVYKLRDLFGQGSAGYSPAGSATAL